MSDVKTAISADVKAAFLAGAPINLHGRRLNAADVEAMCKEAWHDGSRRNLIVNNGTIDGDLVFDYVQTEASIELRSVNLTGTLGLRRTTLNRLILKGCTVGRIEAAGLETARGVDLNNNGGDRFTSLGRVRLVGAVIQGNLEAAGAKFGRSDEDREQDWSALVLDAARIEGNVNVSRVEACGRVRAWGSRIGRTFTCSGKMDELVVRSARVDANANFAGCEVDGPVDLQASTFGGWVSLDGADVGGDLRVQRCSVGGDLNLGTLTVRGRTVNLSGAVVNGALKVTKVCPDQEAVDVRLLGLSVSRLDDAPRCWPARDGDTIEFDDLAIGSMSAPSIEDPGAPSVKDRIEWLERNSRWSPQPWHEVAAVMRRTGRINEARKVAVAGEQAHTRHLHALPRAPHVWLWRMLLQYTIGFGYRPGRALLWGLGIVVVCAIAFVEADFRSRIGAPESSTLLYSIDAFIPVDLGYFGTWTPTQAWWSALAVAEAASGWLLGALLIGALTGLLKKD